MSPVLTAAVPTYNGRHLLERTLPSLVFQSLSDIRIVVIDDGSTDDTRAWLSERWPQIEVTSHRDNRGVTAALNTALTAGDGEFVALLNNDVELAPHCLERLVRELRAHPAASVACGKLLDFEQRDRLDGAGDIYTWGGEANRRGHGELDRGQYDEPEEIFGACGGASVYRRSALAEVGLFDESFFAFYEDVDWSFRSRLMGWGCRYVPDAVGYHMGGATLGRGPSDFVLFQNWRNQIWVIAKNWPLAALVLHLHQLGWVQLRNLGMSLRLGRGRLWLRVWFSVLRGMPGILRERARLRGAQKISLRRLHRIVAAGR